MTLRTTSASKRQHRPGHDERRSLYLNLAFVGAIVASIAILLGAAGVTYYTDHLGQVAKVNEKVITRDDLRARIAVDTWRIDNAEKILSNLIFTALTQCFSEQISAFRILSAEDIGHLHQHSLKSSVATTDCNLIVTQSLGVFRR